MCCSKSLNKKQFNNIKLQKNNIMSFLTDNFWGKILFFLSSFILMLGIPFVLFYILFINTGKNQNS